MLVLSTPICQLVIPELPIPFALFSGLFQLAVALSLDLFGPAFQFVLRRDVTDSTVQPLIIVIGHKLGNNSPSLLQRKWRLGADALDF